MWYRVKNEQGLSLIELLVATVILIIAMVGFSFFLAKGFGVIRNLGSDRLALSFAEGRLERLIGLDFDSVDLNTGYHPSGGWETVTLDDRDGPNDLQGEYMWRVWATGTDVNCEFCKVITLTLCYPPLSNNPAGQCQPSQKMVRLIRISAP